MEIYTGNMGEFGFLYTQFIFYFLAAAIVVTLVASLILVFLPEKVSAFLKKIIFSISIAMYVQNMFMNKYLFAEDGAHMDWNSIRTYSLITTVIWIATVVIIFTINTILKSSDVIIKYGSLFFEAILAVAIISMIITASGKSLSEEHYVLDGSKQCNVASGNNIIVMVLDRYTNEEFDKALENHPEIADIYKDFTYYNNTESCYAYTMPSLEHMLTGNDPDVNMYKSGWQETAWHTDRSVDFYNKLHSNDYVCNIYTSDEAYAIFGELNNMTDLYDNLKMAVPRHNDKLLIALLTKTSIYKYVPYIIKPYFELDSSFAFKDVLVYDNGDGSVAYFNHEFTEGLDDKGISVDEDMKNAFIVMHLNGIHDYYNDEYGYYKEEDINDIDTTKRGVAAITDKYLQLLMQTGTYDKSTIIFMGDHGKNPSREIDPQPMLLIKRAGETHDNMIVNNAPISFDEFQATVLSEAGISYDSAVYGNTFFDYDNKTRERSCSIISDGFRVYTYTGDRYTLMEKIKNDDCVQLESDYDW